MGYFYIVLIGLGGFLGASVRFFISSLCGNYYFVPLGTLIVNCIGSYLVGFILHVQTISYEWRLFLVVGFSGALTTMSAFAYEVFLLLEARQFVSAGLVISAHVIVSLAAVYIGSITAKCF